jgi:hypothetical protein
MPTFCLDCNFEIDEAKEKAGGRQACPLCGSLKRRYEESLCEILAIGALIQTKGYAGRLSRKKGLRFESKDGNSYSVSLDRFVRFNQLVDHEAKRYIKKVIDPVTGQTLREINEPLPDHRDRGSATKPSQMEKKRKK